MVSIMKHTVEVMIPESEIKARIAELGRQINEHYQNSGSEMVLVGLLRGSFMFMADLCREVQVPHEVDFMTASSYGSGMSTTRDVKILKDLDEDLIIEDGLKNLSLAQYPQLLFIVIHASQFSGSPFTSRIPCGGIICSGLTKSP